MASNAIPAPAPLTTIDPAEAARFGAMAADWWNPKGSSAMLHKLNPARLSYIRHAVDRHWSLDAKSLRPLMGKRALDVGCGAGLLCEPLARLGATVTGIDAAPENIAAAQAHAASQGLIIDYRAVGVEVLGENGFDIVTSMEVIEHVTDPARFLQGLADALAPTGLLILSTPNRTALSRLAMITLGEGLGHIPKDTHDWNKFLTPEDIEPMLNAAGLKVTDWSGLTLDPTRGFVLSENKSLNYLLAAEKT